MICTGMGKAGTAVVIIITFLLIGSCQQRDENPAKKNAGPSPASPSQQEKDFFRDKNMLTQPIDLFHLKATHRKHSTFQILPFIRHRYFPSLLYDTGFYGMYHLISECTIPLEMTAILTVYNENNPGDWRFDNEDDQFLELIVLHPEVVIHDVLQTGMTENELILLLGAPDFIIEDLFFYLAGSTTIGIFQLSNGSVKRFKIGRYDLDIKDPLALDFLMRFEMYI